MFSTRTTVAIALPAALIVALTACAGGGGTGSGGSGGSASPTQCLTGKTWSLDVTDAATQLGSQLSSSGLNVISSQGSGDETFAFDADGSVSLAVHLTYTISVALSSGHTLTIVQTHTGNPAGEWAFGDPGVVTFNGWNNDGYSIQNTVQIDGTASDTPVTVPSDTFGDSTPMTITCTATDLTTHIDPSPFTNHWTVAG
ncbi:hypothetical protein BH11ACT4_BH11ACT4_21190 [soil metagenome]